MRRIASVFILSAGLLFASPTPSQAATVGVLNITGTMTVGSGIAYPCFTNSPPGSLVPAVDPSKCLPSSNNTANVTFTTTIAAGSIANGPTSAGKPNTLEAGTFSMLGSGSVTGACGMDAGTISGSITPVLVSGTKQKLRNYTLEFTGFGGLEVVTGSTSKNETLFGVFHLLPTTGTCFNKTPKSFTIVGTLVFLSSALGPVTVPSTTTTLIPPPTTTTTVVVPPPPPLGGGAAAGPSDACTTGTIHDGTTGGVQTKLRVQVVDPQTWVCVRVASGGSGYGGQFVITAPSGGPSVPPLPSNDTQSAMCTATVPNGVPGPHPLAAGQVGDPPGPPYMPYLIDSFSSSGQAWVCVQAGTTMLRVVVPTGVPGVSGLPTVTFNADPGTPDPI